jgi:hypothetical protein
MTNNKSEKENFLLNETIIDEIEGGSVLKKEERSMKAKEFLNILTEMIYTYNHSLK